MSHVGSIAATARFFFRCAAGAVAVDATMKTSPSVVRVDVAGSTFQGPGSARPSGSPCFAWLYGVANVPRYHHELHAAGAAINVTANPSTNVTVLLSDARFLSRFASVGASSYAIRQQCRVGQAPCCCLLCYLMCCSA